MSTPETEIQWFIARDGKQHGPISDVEMKKLVEMGHLRPNDLVWRLGFPDWRPAPSAFPPPAAVTPPPAATLQPTQPAPVAAMPAPAPQPQPQPALSPRPEQPVATAMAVTPAGQPAMQPAFKTGPAPPSNEPMYRAPSFGAPPQGRQPEGPAGVAPPAASAGAAAAPAGSPFSAVPPFAQKMGGKTAGGPTTGGPGTSGRKSDARPATATDYGADIVDEPPRRSRGKLVAATLLLALAGGGGWYSFKHQAELKALLGSAIGSTSKAIEEQAKGTKPAGAKADTAAAASAPENLKQGMAEIDSRLQKAKHWAIIRQQFGDWYQNRLTEAARISAANRPAADVDAYLTQGLVELRRAHADQALAASSTTLKTMASAFQANVSKLAEVSTKACMNFIVSGESSPSVVEIIENPEKNAEINAHFAAIFSAVAEGAKTPTAHSPPTEADYKLLVAELSKLGWAAGDLQLFADPQGPAKTPADRYCKMMQEFFAAHLAVQDPAAQERLLYRTLKLVVAG